MVTRFSKLMATTTISLLVIIGCAPNKRSTRKYHQTSSPIPSDTGEKVIANPITPKERSAIKGEASTVRRGDVELEFRNEPNRMLQKQLDSTKPGKVVFVKPGTYIGTLRIPNGVSIKGTDAEACKILGQVVVQKARGPIRRSLETRMERLTIFHLGGRCQIALKLDGAKVSIRNCLICSNGGFSAVNANDGAVVTLENSIVVGPLGDYALFTRRGGKLSVVNCTLVCRGFGVGLMDNSKATIRNCLFTGIHKIAVVRTQSDYSISHCNIDLGGGDGHELINDNVELQPQHPIPSGKSDRDVVKYDSPGLTFKRHDPPKELSVLAFRKNQPVFAAKSGSKRKDGTVNGLGAFCGDAPGWRIMTLGNVNSPRISAVERNIDLEELKQVLSDAVVTWDKKRKSLRIKASLPAVHGLATWETNYEFAGKPFKPRTGGMHGAEFIQSYYGDLTGLTRMKGSVHIRVFPDVQVVSCNVMGREVKTKTFTYTMKEKTVEISWSCEYRLKGFYGFDKDGDEMKRIKFASRGNSKTNIVTSTYHFPRNLTSFQAKMAGGRMERTVSFDLRVDDQEATTK